MSSSPYASSTILSREARLHVYCSYLELADSLFHEFAVFVASIAIQTTQDDKTDSLRVYESRKRGKEGK